MKLVVLPFLSLADC